MQDEWSKSFVVPIFKPKGNITPCANYCSIKLTSHALKIWEKILEKHLCGTVEIWTGQYGFMLGMSTTDAIFVLGILMEKFREKGWQLSMVFMDLEKAYGHVPRDLVW